MYKKCSLKSFIKFLYISNQVISDHLVLFRNVEELQEQNQKLLAVVRELGETREKEEKTIETQATTEMKQRLEEAVR